jgi:hypothetical protein
MSNVLRAQVSTLDNDNPALARQPKQRENGFSEVTMEAEAELRARLAELKQQHRDLDAAIAGLEQSASRDQLQLTRLKKQKLMLKDQIQSIIDRLIPPIIA